MPWNVLFYIFIFISIIDICHLGLYLVGANIYDIQNFRRQKNAAKQQHITSVTVLIPARNEELSIIRCLDSVCSSKDKKPEVIVIDDASEVIVIDDASIDNTRKLVKQYIKDHPKLNIKLLYKRKNVGKAEALNHALKNGIKSSLVMTLDADSVIAPDAINNAVRYFSDKRVVGVAANVRVLNSNTVLGLVQKFEYMAGYRSKKFFSITNGEYIVGGVGSIYRTEIMKRVGFYDNNTLTEDIGLSLKIVALGNKNHRLVYGADVLAMTEGVHSFKSLLKQRYRWKMGGLQSLLKHYSMLFKVNRNYSFALTWYRLPMAFLGEIIILLEPLALLYVVYLSLQLLSTSMIIGAYLTITLYLLWTIWPDEHMKLTDKLKMSCYLPAMYFLSYILNVVQLVAIFRCLFNWTKLTGKTKVKTNWVSPERQLQGT